MGLGKIILFAVIGLQAGFAQASDAWVDVARDAMESKITDYQDRGVAVSRGSRLVCRLAGVTSEQVAVYLSDAPWGVGEASERAYVEAHRDQMTERERAEWNRILGLLDAPLVVAGDFREVEFTRLRVRWTAWELFDRGVDDQLRAIDTRYSAQDTCLVRLVDERRNQLMIFAVRGILLDLDRM